MFDWQTIVALIIVALAFATLVRRFVGSFKTAQSANCGGGCHGCGHASIKTPFVQIDSRPHGDQ